MLFANRQRVADKKRRRTIRNEYQILETRNLLAVTAMFEAGVLTVGLDQPSNNAVVRNVNGEVTVNDQLVDADADAAGVQALQVTDMTHLVFAGAEGVVNLGAHVAGEFNSGDLVSIEFNNISQATMNGLYDVDSISGNFVGDGFSFFDADGQLTVNDSINFTSNTLTTVEMLNVSNNLQGQINIQSDSNVSIRAASDILLGAMDVGMNLTVRALGGDISNNGAVVVDGVTTLEANNADLGTDVAANLNVMLLDIAGHFDLIESSVVFWGGSSQMGSAHIQAQYIAQGPFSDVDISGSAEFDVDRMRLGVGGRNTFNTGSLNFNAAQHVFIYENSDVQLFGDNSAMDLDLIAVGNIENVDDSTLSVQEISSFQSAGNVNIGNAVNDQFNTGTLQFWGDMINVSEDSDMVIDGLANYAQSLVATANGTITDTFTAYTVIEGNARFVSTGSEPGVTIGNSPEDFFIADSISFDVQGGTFALYEDDSTVISGEGGFINRAESVVISSEGTVGNAADTTVDVENNASFQGTSILIGRETGDLFELGSVTFSTPGDARFTEDSDVMLGGSTFVGGELDIFTFGDIEDGSHSFLNVIGNARFWADNITLGDLAGVNSGESEVDNFMVGTLHFIADSDVEITENSSITLAPETVSSGQTVRLTSKGDSSGVGDITNAAGSQLMAAGNLHLDAVGSVDLGSDAADTINFDNLTFRSGDEVRITAIFADVTDEIFIFGSGNNRNTASEFRLTTNVDVKDGTFAQIAIDDFMQVEARNIILGDTDDDCLMIPDDAIFITEDEAAQVTSNNDC